MNKLFTKGAKGIFRLTKLELTDKFINACDLNELLGWSIKWYNSTASY